MDGWCSRLLWTRINVDGERLEWAILDASYIFRLSYLEPILQLIIGARGRVSPIIDNKVKIERGSGGCHAVFGFY